MKNEIQKLINELLIERENADNTAKQFNHNPYIKYGEEERSKAFSLCIQKLTFLLNAEAGTNGQEDTKNDGNAV